MKRLRWWAVPIVLVLIVLGFDGEAAFAGTVGTQASGWSLSTSAGWYAGSAKGEVSPDLASSMSLQVSDSAASTSTPVPAQGHAECGDVYGRVNGTWDGAVVSITASTATSLGTVGCPASPNWLLHVWVTSNGSTVLDWKSRLIYPTTAIDPLCPSEAPAGIRCVWSVNATASPAAPAASAVPCPTDVTTSYPCMYAINEGSAVPASPLDLAPVTASVDTLRASAVFGICLVLFLLGAALVIRARRSR